MAAPNTDRASTEHIIRTRMPSRSRNQELRSRNLPDHVFQHLVTMARLHAANRYDCLTHDVEAITGRTATSTRDYIARHPELFKPSPPTRGGGFKSASQSTSLSPAWLNSWALPRYTLPHERDHP